MKRQIAIAFAALLVAFTLCPTLNAQTAEPGIHHASIPFAFHVDNHSFPAGDYEIRWLGPRLLIQEVNGSHKALVVVIRIEANEPPNKNYLRFDIYGKRDYFLSEVWMAGLNSGQELLPSKLEKEIASHQQSPATYAMVGLHTR